MGLLEYSIFILILIAVSVVSFALGFYIGRAKGEKEVRDIVDDFCDDIRQIQIIRRQAD